MRLGRYPAAGRGFLAALPLFLLSACAITTEPLDAGERERLAEDATRELFAGQEPIQGPLSLAQATARAIKYQAEHRQRRMEEAATAAQLEVAQFDMLPRITANAGYSWRNNESFGFGITPGGAVAASPSASVERERTTASLGLAWNILDFGTSYFRARQLSDQKLIAEERRRKAVQTLLHDVRVAWWRAEAAERLLPQADRLLEEIEYAIEKTRHIEARKLLPPVQTATLRRALLDLSQQITFRRQDLVQAKVDLAALVNAPPGHELRVAMPALEARRILDLTADVGRLETLALRLRPEMAEEGYRARISQDEARKALVGLLPNLSLDLGRNYDSNRFLVNNTWSSAGLNVALNLVKIFSLPALKRSEEATRAADEARRMAMAMAVLAQTRLAALRYSLVADEFLVWDEAARDDDLIVGYLSASEKVGVDTELELIRSKARAMASHINRDLAYANVEASVARLYNSVGYDAVPRDDEARPVAELSGLIATRFAALEKESFSPRTAAAKPAVAVAAPAGVDARTARLVREGVERVLRSAGFAHTGGAGVEEVEMALQVALEPPEDGKRGARIGVTVTPRSRSTALTREFRTTLSEPIDEEQWRVLGEGAVYRVITDLAPARITRPALRISPWLSVPPPSTAPAPQKAATLDGQPLELRAAAALAAGDEE
jgi:outer membrane protein TolC